MKTVAILLAALATTAAATGALLGGAAAPADGEFQEIESGSSSTWSHAGRIDEHWGTIRVDRAVRASACLEICLPEAGERVESVFDFPVHAGASRILVTAEWASDVPATDRFEVGLHLDDTGGTLRQIATHEGEGGVGFIVEDATRGQYVLDAWPAGPVGAAIDQKITFHVTVEYMG